MSHIKDHITRARCLNIDDMNWKPIYPNNMKCNGVMGCYCLVLHENEEGKYCGRKYSVLFQNEEIESGSGVTSSNKINGYILFEKHYAEIIGPLDYPEAADKTPEDLLVKKDNTFNSADMNSYGSFVYAYTDLEAAKKRALTQYRAIYGYAMSHLIRD